MSPGGPIVPQNTTRYFNGDMSAERFLNRATINESLDEAMFDVNSGYKPDQTTKGEEVAGARATRAEAAGEELIRA
jgi:hypothetical protein